MTVYLISDNHNYAEMLSSQLKTMLPASFIVETGKISAAKKMIRNHKPSALVLDIDSMQGMDAADYIKELCPRYHIPIIVITAGRSSHSKLISAGALDVITVPSGEKGKEKLLSQLTTSIKGSAKVIRHTHNMPGGESSVIVIGGSTGSTNALPVVLKGLPEDCPPVVCVLHMPEGYTKLYASQLNASLPLDVVEAVTGTYLKRGMVVIAAGGRHLRLFRDRKGYFINSEPGVKVNGHCPSVDVLFSSAAYCAKSDALGVILTGMGSDGAKGMLDMRKMGAYNIAEAESTAVVYGMPKAAKENGAANISLPLYEIAGHIVTKLKLK